MKKKQEIIKKFSLNNKQKELITIFLEELNNNNKHTNLVGRSTLSAAWDRHVCDSIQIVSHIKNKKSRIIDIGSGAGIPGVFLSIMGFKNVLMVDSTKKKTDFIKKVLLKLNISAKVRNERIENLKVSPAEYVVCRALAPLEKLMSYSLLLSNKETSLLFLKGRNAKKEIKEAKKFFYFNYELFNSLSSGGGAVLKISNFKKK